MYKECRKFVYIALKSLVTTEELQKLLDGIPEPVYKIEQELKMPKSTLQKALKGQRGLAIKWERALKDKFFKPSDSDMMRLPIDYNRPESEYFGLIRRLADRHSLLVLKAEIEGHNTLTDAQKRAQITSLNFKLQRTN